MANVVVESLAVVGAETSAYTVGGLKFYSNENARDVRVTVGGTFTLTFSVQIKHEDAVNWTEAFTDNKAYSDVFILAPGYSMKVVCTQYTSGSAEVTIA